jgi:hypothetical protein
LEEADEIGSPRPRQSGGFAVVDPAARAHRLLAVFDAEDASSKEVQMCKTTDARLEIEGELAELGVLPAELSDIDDDFAGFATLEEWDAYDRFNDEIDDALLPPPTPIDPELEEVISRLEDEWRSKL